MFVKICGITSEEDALLAVAMGADAVGFIFAPSPRQVQATRVRDIVTRLPREILTVGVFRDAAPEQVLDIYQECRLTGVQLHGHETIEESQWLSSLPKRRIASTAGSIRSSRQAPSGTDADAEARSKKTLPSRSVTV